MNLNDTRIINNDDNLEFESFNSQVPITHNVFPSLKTMPLQSNGFVGLNTLSMNNTPLIPVDVQQLISDTTEDLNYPSESQSDELYQYNQKNIVKENGSMNQNSSMNQDNSMNQNNSMNQTYPMYQNYPMYQCVPVNQDNWMDQSNKYVYPQQGDRMPQDILKEFDLSIEIDGNSLKRHCSYDQIDEVFSYIEENDIGILGTLNSYRSPYPISKAIIKKVIKNTLDYIDKE